MNEPILPVLHKRFPCPHTGRDEVVLLGFHPAPIARKAGMVPADFHLCAECAFKITEAINAIMKGHDESASEA